MSKVTLTTDGACSGNPGPGGWGALLRFGDSEKMLSGFAPETTNNRMELMAVIEGLKAINREIDVHIITDSKYVMDGIQKWIAGWKAKGWKTASKQPVKNQDLWQDLDAQVQRHNKVTWEWVKGHAGHADNERVDEAARMAIINKNNALS